jgi:hypothetical protein
MKKGSLNAEVAKLRRVKMKRFSKLIFSAGLCVLCGNFWTSGKFGGALAADPPRYRLWLVNQDGKWDRQSTGFYREKLAQTDVEILSTARRYKTSPQLPVPVCEKYEFYLFSPADDLIQFGCIDTSFKGSAVPEVREAIRRYAADIRRGKEPQVIQIHKLR